ncbi:hypothetical protein QJS66_16065 [Kocuria rhizophila]|nr:hypothetical protein QJS66_16065 [Kocuria rhizophila]
MLLRMTRAHLGELLTSESSLCRAVAERCAHGGVSTALCVVLGCPLALVWRAPPPGASPCSARWCCCRSCCPGGGRHCAAARSARASWARRSRHWAWTSRSPPRRWCSRSAWPCRSWWFRWRALRTTGTRYEQIAAGLGASHAHALPRDFAGHPARRALRRRAVLRALPGRVRRRPHRGPAGACAHAPLEIYLQRGAPPWPLPAPRPGRAARGRPHHPHDDAAAPLHANLTGGWAGWRRWTGRSGRSGVALRMPPPGWGATPPDPTASRSSCHRRAFPSASLLPRKQENPRCAVGRAHGLSWQSGAGVPPPHRAAGGRRSPTTRCGRQFGVEPAPPLALLGPTG